MTTEQTELDYHAIVSANYGALDLPGLLRVIAQDLDRYDAYRGVRATQLYTIAAQRADVQRRRREIEQAQMDAM